MPGTGFVSRIVENRPGPLDQGHTSVLRMSLFAAIAPLPLDLSEYRLEPHSQGTGGGWTRRTTAVTLRGGGLEGSGEDVTYTEGDQVSFQEAGATLSLAGRYTFEEFSHRLQGLELFPNPPVEPNEHHYRRWAFESAALDLALRQAGKSLADLLHRPSRPVSFVVSTGLGEPASTKRLEQILQLYPVTEFKVDLSETWTEDLVASLVKTGAIRIVDLKGHYRGTFQGPPANPEQYGWIAKRLAKIWIEDPELNEATGPVLAAHTKRITWDAVLHSLEDVLSLPFPPTCINVKPSRFGTVAELLALYEHCMANGIGMYGGGQFELAPGRGQIQYLASLFHPDAPNDVAPRGFNEQEIGPGLASSPLPPTPAPVGFAWD